MILLWKWKKKLSAFYLEECKYKIKKTETSKFINTELESNSGSELESDTKLKAKIESDSDFDSE